MSDVLHLVGRMAAGDLVSLTGYRQRPGWALREDGGQVFLIRVPAADGEDFRKLPLLARWSADAEGRLTREGRRIPEAVLPVDGWLQPASLLPVGAPMKGLPGMSPAPVRFQLLQGGAERPAEALLCRGEDFLRWVGTAFSRRLDGLHFAASADGRVFVTGTPLPPVPGTGYHACGKLWIPSGHTLPDWIWSGLVEDVLDLGNNRVALLHADGSHEDIAVENLIPATRASVRNTMAGYGEGREPC